MGFEFGDPPCLDLVDRHGVEVVEFLPAPPVRGDEPGALEDGEVFGDGLPGHPPPGAQLPESEAVGCEEPVEELPAGRVGQRRKDQVVVVSLHGPIMQPFGCMSSDIRVAAVKRVAPGSLQDPSTNLPSHWYATAALGGHARWIPSNFPKPATPHQPRKFRPHRGRSLVRSLRAPDDAITHRCDSGRRTHHRGSAPQPDALEVTPVAEQFGMGQGCVRFRTLDYLPLDVVGRTVARATPAEQAANYQSMRGAHGRKPASMKAKPRK